jgi:hypothetical protein
MSDSLHPEYLGESGIKHRKFLSKNLETAVSFVPNAQTWKFGPFGLNGWDWIAREKYFWFDHCPLLRPASWLLVAV